MRIIVATGLNTGAAEYKNLGDVAMLQVAIARLLSLWPDACIDVLTESPADLVRHCPSVSPLPRAGCMFLMEDRVLLGRYPSVPAPEGFRPIECLEAGAWTAMAGIA